MSWVHRRSKGSFVLPRPPPTQLNFLKKTPVKRGHARHVHFDLLFSPTPCDRRLCPPSSPREHVGLFPVAARGAFSRRAPPPRCRAWTGPALPAVTARCCSQALAPSRTQVTCPEHRRPGEQGGAGPGVRGAGPASAPGGLALLCRSRLAGTVPPVVAGSSARSGHSPAWAGPGSRSLPRASPFPFSVPLDDHPRRGRPALLPADQGVPGPAASLRPAPGAGRGDAGRGAGGPGECRGWRPHAHARPAVRCHMACLARSQGIVTGGGDTASSLSWPCPGTWRTRWDLSFCQRDAGVARINDTPV